MRAIPSNPKDVIHDMLPAAYWNARHGVSMAQIPDRSGNSKHFLQSDSAKRPTLTTQSNVDCWSFDGSNDSLGLSYDAFGSAYPYAVVMKAYNSAADGVVSFLCTKGNPNVPGEFSPVYAYFFSGRVYSDPKLTTGFPTVISPAGDYRNQWCKIVLTVTSSANKIDINGASASTAHAMSVSNNSIDFLMSARGDGNCGANKIAYMALFNRELTSGEISSLP